MNTRWRYSNHTHYDKKEKGKPFMALYGIFCQDKNGVVKGLVENSFSMSWSLDHVNLWSKNDAAEYLRKNYNYKDRSGSDIKFFLVRLTHRSRRLKHKKILIEADWNNYHEILDKGYDKWHYRNIRFYYGTELVDEFNVGGKSSPQGVIT